MSSVPSSDPSLITDDVPSSYPSLDPSCLPSYILNDRPSGSVYPDSVPSNTPTESGEPSPIPRPSFVPTKFE
jgi:hypothetical protein